MNMTISLSCSIEPLSRRSLSWGRLSWRASTARASRHASVRPAGRGRAGLVDKDIRRHKFLAAGYGQVVDLRLSDGLNRNDGIPVNIGPRQPAQPGMFEAIGIAPEPVSRQATP